MDSGSQVEIQEARMTLGNHAQSIERWQVKIDELKNLVDEARLKIHTAIQNLATPVESRLRVADEMVTAVDDDRPATEITELNLAAAKTCPIERLSVTDDSRVYLPDRIPFPPIEDQMYGLNDEQIRALKLTAMWTRAKQMNTFFSDHFGSFLDDKNPSLTEQKKRYFEIMIELEESFN